MISDKLVSAEVHARYLASRLTRYTFTEVAEAAADVDAARVEWETLMSEVWLTHFAALREERYNGYFLWYTLLEGDESALYDLCAVAETPVVSLGHGNEFFPIRQWAKAARQYRRLTARLQTAVKRFEAVAA